MQPYALQMRADMGAKCVRFGRMKPGFAGIAVAAGRPASVQRLHSPVLYPGCFRKIFARDLVLLRMPGIELCLQGRMRGGARHLPQPLMHDHAALFGVAGFFPQQLGELAAGAGKLGGRAQRGQPAGDILQVVARDGGAIAQQGAGFGKVCVQKLNSLGGDL